MKPILFLPLLLLAFSCGKPSREVIDSPETQDMMSLAGTAGRLRGSYGLEGTFTADSQGIHLNDDYKGNTAPGPVWYLSNSANSIVGGVYLADAVGSGATTLPTTQALDFNYLILWCEPFGVLIGFGQIPK